MPKINFIDALPTRLCETIKPKIKIMPNLFRDHAYRIKGNTVDIGQGCVFVGHSNQRLESYGFDTCAPFIMFTNKDGKRVLGHIDSHTTPQQIVDKIKADFAPKEIENASYHYFKGADALAPGKNLGQLAINVIEEALQILGVKGKYHGQLTPYDKVIVDNEGISVEAFDKIRKKIDF